MNNAERTQRNRDYRKSIMNDFKRSKPCNRCGLQFPVYAMDLDHIDPETKVANVSRMTKSNGVQALLVELEKCQVVCANCHRTKSKTQLRSPEPLFGVSKLCKHCDSIKDLSLFHKDKRLKSNRAARCKDCQSTVNQKSRTARLDWLIRYKEESPCFDCGNKYSAEVMDFDHLPEFQKILNVGIMAARGFSRSNILAEIAKCDLVCANCHRMRTFNRRQK